MKPQFLGKIWNKKYQCQGADNDLMMDDHLDVLIMGKSYRVTFQNQNDLLTWEVLMR